MEPLDSERPTSQTDIVNVRAPSPVTRNTGSDCSILNTKVVVTAEATVEKRDDVTLRLMGHLIPGSTKREEDLASETDSSIESTPSTLKRRLKNLPPPSEAVKLANRRVRRESDLYLHLQGVTNRIEEKDESEVTISTTDSSRTVIDSESNRRHQGQVSEARARRRERLNSSLAMSQHRQSSDPSALCSSELSSPEPLTLREIKNFFHGETTQVPLNIKDRYCSDDDPIIHLTRDGNSDLTQNFRKTDETNSDFEDANSPEDLINCNSSPEVENTQSRSTYKTPTRFGGYRPTSELIFRNLSSDSESEATSERIARRKFRCQHFQKEDIAPLEIQDAEEQSLHSRKVTSSNLFSNPDRSTQVEPFSMEEIEVLESGLISPVPSADSRLSFEESNISQRLQTCSELRIPQEITWESMSPSERNHYLDSKIGNVVDSPIRHFDNGQFMEVELSESFSKDFTFSKNSNISLEPLHQNNVNLLENTSKTSASETEGLITQNENHALEHSQHSHAQRGHNSTDNSQPNIPSLDMDYSQYQSLSSDAKDETNRSSLDVSALIQALSDVSIRREKNATYRTNQSMLKLKSPLGYGNRFSGSSGPRSSEYTPAAGGSRQSLSSQDASEADSVRKCKAESSEKSARLSSRSLKASEELAQPEPTPNAKTMPKAAGCARDGPQENDSSRGSDFVPIVAKVNKTNLVCPKHSLRVKSISKLISPRKYQNTQFEGKTVASLTSRTDVSRSSEECRNSFRSLKSIKILSKVPEKIIHGPSQPMTISGRRILEPLNSTSKIQPDLLTNSNRKFNPRRKTTNDLAQVISTQSRSERTTCSSRKSPSSQINRVDLPTHRFAKRPENSTVQNSPDISSMGLVHQTENLSGSRTPGEPFHNISRPTTERGRKLFEHSLKGGKSPCASSARSSLTSGNMLYLRSEGHSMSSGDYDGRTNWSSPSRDDDLTANDGTTSGVIHLDLKDTRSFGNCVHLNDLQDGREVTLPCRVKDVRRQEDHSTERELFEHLPNEISACLTRHCSLGTQVTKNLHSSKEIPNTFEDLRKNIQDNNDQWIKNFKSDDDLRQASPGYSDFSPGGKLVSSSSSPVRFRISHNQSRNLFRNQTKIPFKVPFVNPLQKIIKPTGNSCFIASNSRRIDPGSSECSTPLYRDIRQESEYNSEFSQLDSQRSLPMNSGANSYRNTNYSIVESSASTTVLKFDDALDQEISEKHLTSTIGEPSSSPSGSPQKETVTQEAGLCDVQVISKNVTEKGHRIPCSGHPSDASSNAEEHENYEEALGFESAEVISVSDYEVEAIERSNISECESCITENVPNSKCNSILNAALECPEFEELGKLSVSEKHHEQDKEQSPIGSGDKENRFASELQDQASTNLPNDSNLTRYRDTGLGVYEKNSSPNSNESTKLQTSRQHKQDAMVSSPVKSTDLNSSTDSKWDITLVQSGANSLRKSQDRFPFTISESASRKGSKYKVVANVSLDQMIQEQNANTGSSDAVMTQQPILETLDDGDLDVDEKSKIESCNVTPFLEELTKKISNDFPQRWPTEIPSIGLNYISYGCRPEVRTLMPTMKEIVKKFSAKLRYSGAKRCQDSAETNVEILYKNKKCRYESGEGSSSAASLYQSQFLTTNKLMRGSTDGSRASSPNAVKPKRNHECISMSIKQQAEVGCDQNDIWIQEFDSDVEFDRQAKTEAMHRSSSPVNDRYSIFLARRTFSGILNEEADHNGRLNTCESGDNEKVTSKRRNSIDKLYSKMQNLVSNSAMPPPNSTNEFEIQTSEDDFDDSTVKTGCFCFRIYHFFTTYRKHSSKTRQGTRVWEIK